MTVLRLRGQGLSVLISALYLTHGPSANELELVRSDVLEQQILLQGTDQLTSLMWKVIEPLLTREWDVYRVAFGGITRKSGGRVALLDSAQALIELDGRRSVRLVEAASPCSGQTLWVPNLEDPRLEAKVVAAGKLEDLREPVVVDVNADNLPGTYAQYVPLGGSQTLFTRHTTGMTVTGGNAAEFALHVLGRLAALEAYLLDEL